MLYDIVIYYKPEERQQKKNIFIFNNELQFSGNPFRKNRHITLYTTTVTWVRTSHTRLKSISNLLSINLRIDLDACEINMRGNFFFFSRYQNLTSFIENLLLMQRGFSAAHITLTKINVLNIKIFSHTFYNIFTKYVQIGKKS